jgi:hypothetical protein
MKYNKFEALMKMIDNPKCSADADDNITWFDEREKPSDADIDAKVKELNDAEPMRQLRILRNKKLQEVDWKVTKAMSTGTEVPQATKDYMQKLRDLPLTATPKCDERGLLDLTSFSFPEE